ncbi:MAG: hypothetical protein IJ094_05580 [Bacilli bacterium]|nr:hypothetical protein [Bacilli bacterium]
MGLKSKLSKMKSFLFDEVDDEKEIKKSSKIKPEKIETKKKEHNDYKTEKEDIIEELFLDDPVKEENTNVEVQSRSQKQKFNFQEFDDDDFMVAKKKPEPLIKKEPKKEKPKEPKRVLYQGSKIKNDNKKFTPSPIISPIYGLLDNEGNMVKKTKEQEKNNDMTFDLVRKKAYGIEDEEDINSEDLKKKTIEEAEKEMNENLSREKKKKEEPVSYDPEEDDDMILPNINFKEIDVDKKISKKKNTIDTKKTNVKAVSVDDEDDDDDTKEQDLFNLIDTMYQKEGDDK